jgi:Ca-activated chloride channel homolog
MKYFKGHYCFFSICLKTFSLFTASFLLTACSLQIASDSDRKLLYRSMPEYPPWISQLPVNSNYFYALGISTNTASLREGRLSAAQDAIVEVSHYLGLQARAQLQIEKTELTTRILNEMTLNTSSRLTRSRLTKMYYEEFILKDSPGTSKNYDVYILLRIPMTEIAEEQKRQKLKKQNTLKTAKAINQEAQAHYSEGNFILAWQKWILAMQLLDKDETNKIASLNIYKTLLTAVEGINLSIKAKNSTGDIPLSVIARANYTHRNTSVALQNMPLHFRLISNNHVGEIIKTNSAGLAEYRFPASAKRELEARIVMSPYVVNKTEFSSELSNQVYFLESMLRNKTVQYGTTFSTLDGQTVNHSQQFKSNMLLSGGNTTNKTKVSIEVNTPYILADKNKKNSLLLMVSIKPTTHKTIARTPLNLSVIIDKSSSMNEGNKFNYTKNAVDFLISQLTPQDYISIVAYSTDVEVIAESQVVSFQGILKHKLSELHASGMTNLSSGLFEGYEQVKKNHHLKRINRLLLLSDGRANQGIIQSDGLTPYSKQYATEGISISTLGVGQDYNEELLIDLAEQSNGNYYYIKNPEDIPGIFRQELDSLINIAAQNILISVKLNAGVELAETFDQPYILNNKNEYQFRLGDIAFTEQGILLLELNLPTKPLGKHDIAQVKIQFQNTDNHTQTTSTKPISIVYTRQRNLVETNKNLLIEKYALLARSIEQLERVIESLDEDLYQQAIQNINSIYAELEAFTSTSEDAIFLQRMQFLKHFQHEINELYESGDLHNHNQDARKKLSYQLYLEKHSHRSLLHPLHLPKSPAK